MAHKYELIDERTGEVRFTDYMSKGYARMRNHSLRRLGAPFRWIPKGERDE